MLTSPFKFLRVSFTASPSSSDSYRYCIRFIGSTKFSTGITVIQGGRRINRIIAYFNNVFNGIYIWFITRATLADVMREIAS